MIRLLVVDDSALMRRLLRQVFEQAGGFELSFARNGVEALEQLHAVEPDVVTLDVHMPQMDGLACLDRIMVERPCPVVMVSSLTEAGAETTLDALALGAVGFVAKPAGAISLSIDTLAPALVEAVRTAAGARMRRSIRLADRVRLRNRVAAPAPRPMPRPMPEPGPMPMPGPGPGPGPGPVCASVTGSRSSPLPGRGPGRATGAVLVGCSTGGPPALDALLGTLPAEFPWPILVAQHMPATFTGPLARRLDQLCALNVVEVSRPVALVPGHVYIGRGDADLVLGMRPEGPVAMAAPSLASYHWHPSVDRMVNSALQHLAATQLIGVLMTGMGDDGAAMMSRLREAGGRTIAEAEESAVIWGMPGALVRAGGASCVAPLARIGGQLLEWLM